MVRHHRSGFCIAGHVCPPRRSETQKGTFYSVTPERSYKDDDGKWQYTSSLGQADLLLAAKVIDLAHSRIDELRAAERKAQPEDEAA